MMSSGLRTARRFRWFAACLLFGSVFLGLLLGSPPMATEENPHGRLSIACSVCHTAASWRVEGSPPGFDHASVGYVLEGAHRQATCAACHHDPIFSRVGTSCLDCHADVHQAGMGTDCQRCHTPHAWGISRSAVDQHAATAFPLVGVHATVDCDACHRTDADGDYSNAPLTCDGCHMALYAATTNPAHASVGFGTRCDECHSSASRDWTAGSFVHPPSFPLLGAHARARCADCHASGYTGTPTGCYDCHADEFTSTSDPSHVSAGFSHDCTQCHGYASWSGADFDHGATGFPLTGAHLSARCLACHAGGFSGTSSACYSCHQSDFTAATDPNHVVAGFSHDCTACHGTSRWDDSTWDHDPLFPIYSGTHRGRWTQCSECHVQSTSYAVFECILCHEHGQSETDGHHQEVSGYVYQSQACYDCHPQGRH